MERWYLASAALAGLLPIVVAALVAAGRAVVRAVGLLPIRLGSGCKHVAGELLLLLLLLDGMMAAVAAVAVAVAAARKGWQ